MLKKIVIFGMGPSAEVVTQICEEFELFEIVAYTVDKDFVTQERYLSKPLIPFDDLHLKFPASDYGVFVCVGYGQMNTVRERIWKKVKTIGYRTPSVVHPNSHLPGDFVHGDNCFIMNDVHIHPCVEIGKNNFIWSGTTLCHHVKVGDHCWFTSGSSVAGNSNIGHNCFFGINSVVTNNIKIGPKSFIGAGALASKNLKSKTVIIKQQDGVFKLDSSQFMSLIGNNF